ncbi:MAG: alanine--tRNA ligase, partial [Gammaproteobacteria bacterium]|nr:alanine--tRNA ligase [Gammaproteobacteria bacterium]
MSYQFLRTEFLEYFKQKDHKIMPSSSLIPADDPSILFTNAGMNQFKDWFLGTTPALAPATATAQRCVRAGGKHNDLENVGYTARHHTFFEMLGNFSFGSYFKTGAIEYAWSFIRNNLSIPQDKLWITVHHQDQESFKIWRDHIGVDEKRIVFCSDKDNFWAMGDRGPCGPCTEIFYDHGPSVAGGPPGSPDADGDRYMEIWNLVFMQYDRQADGSYLPLPKPCVDTGMGLERLACVYEGVFSNFDTSLFRLLKTSFADQIGCPITEVKLNVLADHCRASVFLIADGATPSAEGRGYVLRRLIRRALSHGYQLGLRRPFLHQHVKVVVRLMQDAYPYLKEKIEHCEKVIAIEEQQFF